MVRRYEKNTAYPDLRGIKVNTKVRSYRFDSCPNFKTKAIQWQKKLNRNTAEF